MRLAVLLIMARWHTSLALLAHALALLSGSMVHPDISAYGPASVLPAQAQGRVRLELHWDWAPTPSCSEENERRSCRFQDNQVQTVIRGATSPGFACAHYDTY